MRESFDLAFRVYLKTKFEAYGNRLFPISLFLKDSQHTGIGYKLTASNSKFTRSYNACPDPKNKGITNMVKVQDGAHVYNHVSYLLAEPQPHDLQVLRYTEPVKLRSFDEIPIIAIVSEALAH